MLNKKEIHITISLLCLTFPVFHMVCSVVLNDYSVSTTNISQVKT